MDSSEPGNTAIVDGEPYALALEIPASRIVSIEHPCIVQNIENGLKSLGGEPQLRHVLDHQVGGSSRINGKATAQKTEPIAGVSLRPHDPFARKLTSVGLPTQNVLVKVVLPKRTGRKRKRGSDEPFQTVEKAPVATRLTAPELLRCIRDNDGKVKVEPMGMLRETHRFRGLPDFQLHGSDIPIMQRIRTQIMAPSYDALKDFKVDLSMGAEQGATLFPGPPNFTYTEQPFKYEYQPSTAKEIRELKKKAAALDAEETQEGGEGERGIRGLDPDVTDIPSQPLPYAKMRFINEEFVKQAEVKLKELLEQRPIVTRRYIEYHVPGSYNDLNFKEAIHRVAYTFKAGPFMNCLIKYGLDPRRDPQYRFYQIFQFQDTRPDKTRRTVPIAEGEENYIFDGVTPPPRVGKGAKTWQFCDITDPLLSQLVNTAELPTSFDCNNWGWYHNGTLCKLRVLMRDKMRCLLDGVALPQDLYKLILTIPDKITAENMSSTYFPNHFDQKLYKLSSEVRELVKVAAGLKTKDPRFPRQRMLRENMQTRVQAHPRGESSPYFLDDSSTGPVYGNDPTPDEGSPAQVAAGDRESDYCYVEEQSDASIEVDPMLDAKGAE